MGAGAAGVLFLPRALRFKARLSAAQRLPVASLRCSLSAASWTPPREVLSEKPSIGSSSRTAALLIRIYCKDLSAIEACLKHCFIMPFQIIDSQALCIFFASAVSVAPVGALHTAPRQNIQTGGEAQQPEDCAVADTSAHIAQNDRTQNYNTRAAETHTHL